MITNSQAATDRGVNSRTIGTLTERDIEDHSDCKPSGISLSGGFSAAVDSGADKDGEAGSGPKLYDPGKTGVTGAGFGASSTSGHEHTITRSGIGLGMIVITDEAAPQAHTGQSAAEAIVHINRNELIGD